MSPEATAKRTYCIKHHEGYFMKLILKLFNQVFISEHLLYKCGVSLSLACLSDITSNNMCEVPSEALLGLISVYSKDHKLKTQQKVHK